MAFRWTRRRGVIMELLLRLSIHHGAFGSGIYNRFHHHFNHSIFTLGSPSVHKFRQGSKRNPRSHGILREILRSHDLQSPGTAVRTYKDTIVDNFRSPSTVRVARAPNHALDEDDVRAASEQSAARRFRVDAADPKQLAGRRKGIARLHEERTHNGLMILGMDVRRLIGCLFRFGAVRKQGHVVNGGFYMRTVEPTLLNNKELLGVGLHD